jgi:hypothetical protein
LQNADAAGEPVDAGDNKKITASMAHDHLFRRRAS